MHLKCIKLAGFKSFVDPTTVRFPSNLCAIVGPNGCGKSNIIDAVRWVMGESSAKNLRGESMDDVIFNGSSARKPLGQASIELIFDNSSTMLKGDLAKYAEISIRRKVIREGTSTYYLNGTKCRRRDIRDIFLGTGLGPRSYAIIEQGTISRLIDAKPEELRRFVEEAAGISKYKERRRETENRIRSTRDNLDRLSDIREELEKQLQTLKRQSEAAAKYREFKKEERTLRAQVQAMQWRSLEDSGQAEKAALQESELSLEAAIAELRGIDANIERGRVNNSERAAAFNDVQASYYSLGADIARIEQTIKHQEDRSRELKLELEQANENNSEIAEHLDIDAGKLKASTAELQSIEPELDGLKVNEQQAADALSQAEVEMQSWQQTWDEFNEQASAATRAAEVLQSRIQHLQQNRDAIQGRIDRLQEEQDGLQGVQPGQDLTGLSEQLAASELLTRKLEDNSAELVLAIEKQRQMIATSNDELNESRASLQSLKGRQASLQALQDAALGREDDACRQWLHKNGLASAPRLSQSLKVEAGWEQALETVLGDCLQAVSVDSIDDYAKDLRALDSGQLMLMQQGGAQQSSEGASLAAKIRSGGGAAIAELLAGVYAASDTAAALRQRPQLATGESIITRDGIWFGANWMRVAREQDTKQGMLQREAELEGIARDIRAIEEQESDLANKLQADTASLRELEATLDEQQRDLAGKLRVQGDIDGQIREIRVRLEESTLRQDRNTVELSENRDRFEAELGKLENSQRELEAALQRMQHDDDRRAELLQTRDSKRRSVDEARARAAECKDSYHAQAMRCQSLRSEVEAMNKAIAAMSSQAEELQQRQTRLTQELGELEQPLQGSKQELQQILQAQLNEKSRRDQARAELEESEQQLRDYETARLQTEEKVQSIRQGLEEKRVKIQTLLTRQEGLIEQLQENDHDLRAVLAETPEDAELEQWQDDLQKLANRIQRLGNINLAAIDEFEAQQERKTYLDAQNEELQTALSTLEKVIRKIDKETRSRFKETFDKINTGLGELFPRVFGGGHAYLEMTGDDLLDTGIAIMARPPGKRNSTIHLLSGGEKALTAIALVFSIFQLTPAPFCMLDEVDAPLDDVNVGRYARMVQEMSKEQQFIYISHNKIAMQMAQQLMGVTMHEAGVSRLVSVDVDEAVELAAV